jgi:hypothetical protein
MTDARNATIKRLNDEGDAFRDQVESLFWEKEWWKKSQNEQVAEVLRLRAEVDVLRDGGGAADALIARLEGDAEKNMATIAQLRAILAKHTVYAPTGTCKYVGHAHA